MLRDRLWVGALLILLVVGVLLLDRLLAPWYPVLLVLILVLSLFACFELRALLGPERSPPALLCAVSLVVLILANWAAHVPLFTRQISADPWHWILGTFAAVVLLGFLWAMATFDPEGESGKTLTRLAYLLFFAGYLGLLPAFLAQLRWPSQVRVTDVNFQAVLALAMTIFVPKFCDIGAYFTGRLLGRTKMTPILSPKKTWEGLIGGLVVAMAIAAGLNHFGPVLPGPWWVALGFGLTVGIAGVLGDLAESLIKRECRKKDASQAVPGFGGVLDIVDSILFAAPVAYLWLAS